MTEPPLLKTPSRSRPHHASGAPSPSFSYQTPKRRYDYQDRSLTTPRRLTTVIPRISPSPAARRRLQTPGRAYGANFSPHTETGDRFIPSRREGTMELCRHFIQSGEKRRRDEEARGRRLDPTSSSPPVPKPHASQETSIQKDFKRRMLSSLCNIPIESLNEDGEPTSILSFGSANNARRRDEAAQQLLASGVRLEDPYVHGLQMFRSEPDMVDPIGLQAPANKVTRKIQTAASRILDAPDYTDDFYLNLISWSQDNILAVALGQCIYLWNAATGDIQHLCTIRGTDDYATSVSWCTVPGQTKYLAVGTNSSTVQLWDAQSLRKVRTLTGHTGRVSSLAWSRQWLSTGSRDSLILQHDVRSANHVVAQYQGHTQEVCGLKWTEDSTTLASGGNENYVCLWDAAMSASSLMSQRRQRESNSGSGNEVAPRLILTEHHAAVKALAWCPFHRGLLATGGGTADRTIKFWNSNSGSMLNSIDTGSQVCALLWSRHQRELCSSHGFSENQLILWKYPTMTKIQEFKGHTSRVLNMELSPDGGCVVSAAADETLRFWDIFGAPPRKQGNGMFSMGDLSLPGMPTVR